MSLSHEAKIVLNVKWQEFNFKMTQWVACLQGAQLFTHTVTNSVSQAHCSMKETTQAIKLYNIQACSTSNQDELISINSRDAFERCIEWSAAGVSVVDTPGNGAMNYIIFKLYCLTIPNYWINL